MLDHQINPFIIPNLSTLWNKSQVTLFAYKLEKRKTKCKRSKKYKYCTHQYSFHFSSDSFDISLAIFLDIVFQLMVYLIWTWLKIKWIALLLVFHVLILNLLFGILDFDTLVKIGWIDLLKMVCWSLLQTYKS